MHRIRQVDLDDNLRIWRNFKMGRLFDLIMLDTRNYDRSITSLDWNDNYITELKDDAARSLMGSHQENWFYNQLSESHARGATWRIIGNQIIFSRMNNSAVYSDPVNTDQWDVRGPFDYAATLSLTGQRATQQIAIAHYTISTPTRSLIQRSWPATHTPIGCPI